MEAARQADLESSEMSGRNPRSIPRVKSPEGVGLVNHLVLILLGFFPFYSSDPVLCPRSQGLFIWTF